jgi:hypothetical protein
MTDTTEPTELPTALQLIPGLRVHDAVIEHITLGEPCSVRFRRVDGSLVELRMTSSTRYGATGLMSSPIVHSVEKFDARGAVPPDTIRVLSGGYWVQGDGWRNLVGEARFIVGMSFSYGDGLAVACNEVHVVELESTHAGRR